MNRRWKRWLPAAAVPAVVAAGALVSAFQAGAGDELPAKSPEQVLAMVAAHKVSALSGTLEQTSDLGLPQLSAPGAASGPTSSALDLLTGPHTARVYLNGPRNVRVQVLDSLAERDVVRHGSDLWLYNSKDRTATHVTLPAEAAVRGGTATDRTPAPAWPTGSTPTPEELAQRLLAAADPSTDITLGATTKVAGRNAYDLVLTPHASDTLIGSVSVAVDAATGLPLSVDVQARGQDQPAFRVEFTSLSLGAPPAGLFSFSPPPGALVKELPAIVQTPKQRPLARPGTSSTQGSHPARPTVSGDGWDAVAEIRAAELPSSLTGSPLLTKATSSVAGGRLLSTSLVNVLFTNDGRVFAGSVPLQRLQAAAAAG